jgi:arsenate reductase
MDGATIYHNPACGKSRGALEILRQRGLSLDIIEYLKTPADRAALGRILDRLPGEAAELVRKDKRFQELGLNAANYQTRAQVIDLLVAHPELMERPVVLHGARAVIARPAERVNEILD